MMKKAAAIISAVAVMGSMTFTAFAADNDNIIEDVVSGAGDVVDGVVDGAEDVVDGVVGGTEEAVPGDSDSIVESVPENSTIVSPDTVPDNVIGDSTSVPENVQTGVPALELAALGTAAVGGLAAMAATVRKKSK